MKVLQINCVYKKGSTGKIVASIRDCLRAKGHDVFVCYGIGEKSIDAYSAKVCTGIEHIFNALLSRVSGIPYGGLFFSNVRIKNIMRRFKPDVVHVHCVNGSTLNVYQLLKYLAKSGIKTVLTLHAEIFHTAGCAHAFDCEKWKTWCMDCSVYKQRVNSWLFDRSSVSYRYMFNAIHAFSSDKLIVTGVSPWLTDRARCSAIMKGYYVTYVPNGVDTSVFFHRNSIGLINRNDYSRVVLFVTPYFGMEEDDLKGGRYLSKIARKLPNYKFIAVYSRKSNSMGKLPSNIELWGRATSQEELSQLYSEADVTMVLSLRETFSMVTAESLCCGTPVVGFKAGGPESIALKDYSCFVAQGDLDALVQYLTNQPEYDAEIVSSKAIAAYSQEIMSQMFYDLYQMSK